jgi:hypothetical protein
LSEFDLRSLIRRGDNVTATTKFGALDVVQRAQSRTQDLLDLENLPES